MILIDKTRNDEISRRTKDTDAMERVTHLK